MKKKHKKKVSPHGHYESADPMVGLPHNTLDAKEHSPKKKKVLSAKKNVEILADSKKKEKKDHKHDTWAKESKYMPAKKKKVK